MRWVGRRRRIRLSRSAYANWTEVIEFSRRVISSVPFNQYPDYLALQLRLFKAGNRGGTGYAPVMREIAGRLEEDDIRDLSAYASLR